VLTYRWCDLAICTNFELPELSGAGGSPETSNQWHVTLESGAPPERPHREWFHHWEFPDGRKWVAFARDEGGYLLRFPGLADFDIVPSARTIGGYPHPATPLHTVRHLLLDQVLPLVAGGRDQLALHGSAVAIGPGAVVFLGGSGYGKSTLAARLARPGRAVVTDDCCLVTRTASGFHVVPSYPGVRLGPDSVSDIFGDADREYASVAHYTTKVRVAGEGPHDLRFHAGGLPLTRIYVIGSMAELHAATSVAIERRTTRAALLDLLNYTFYLDVGDPVRLREGFQLAADVALRHDVRSLVFPWDLSKSGAVAEAILSDR